jgi:hypothetical protein
MDKFSNVWGNYLLFDVPLRCSYEATSGLDRNLEFRREQQVHRDSQHFVYVYKLASKNRRCVGW